MNSGGSRDIGQLRNRQLIGTLGLKADFKYDNAEDQRETQPDGIAYEHQFTERPAPKVL